jgi:hypothetical protein
VTVDGLLTPRQTLFAAVTTTLAMLFIIDLVRRRRLAEEYSWLWLLTGAAMILLVASDRLLLALGALIGAATPIITLLIFAVLFLFAIAVHYSLIISRLSEQVKALAQELAIMSTRGEAGRDRGSAS